MTALPPLNRRIIPLHGTEAQRALKADVVDARELIVTTDQRRSFVGSQVVAPVWHGEVADQAEMLALHATVERGCWEGDGCYRADLGQAARCIANNGEKVAEWFFYPAGGGVEANYFGDGADGAATISADTTLESDTGVDDTGVVIRNYTDLTIDAGKTLTAARRVKAMLLYVDGDLVVNGTLHMDARGAAGAASDVMISRILAARIFPNEAANNLWVIPAAGAAGGAGGPVNTVGGAGAAGVNGQTGGGGGGGGHDFVGGAGAAGTAYVGGSGGGGAGNTGAGGAASANGATGGAAGSIATYQSAIAGGAGNPAGSSNVVSPATVSAAPGGGGGTLILIVRGDVTLGAAGRISADGSRGGNATATGAFGRAVGGGGAGGGSVLILYGGAYTNNGTVQAAGGAGGTATGGAFTPYAGGAGGAGSVRTAQISAT